MHAVSLLRSSRRFSTALAAGWLILFLVGCGSDGPAGKVTGTVTIDGKPAPAGSKVVFVDQKTAQSAFGIVQDDGSYYLRTNVGEGAWVGSSDVAVMPPETSISPEEAMEMSMRGETPDFTSVIPEKYHSPTTSGLTYTVKEGENTFDIQIQLE